MDWHHAPGVAPGMGNSLSEVVGRAAARSSPSRGAKRGLVLMPEPVDPHSPGSDVDDVFPAGSGVPPVPVGQH